VGRYQLDCSGSGWKPGADSCICDDELSDLIKCGEVLE
jgi:hypothetical protein